MQLCIDASISDFNERIGKFKSQEVIGYQTICTSNELLVDGNILNSSVKVGVSEFQYFVEPLGINTYPEIVDDIYRRPGVSVTGAFFDTYTFCGALKIKSFKHPLSSPRENNYYSMCCSKGKIDIEEKSPTPAAEYFVDLWSTDEMEGKVFRKNAIKINNEFSLS